MSEPSERLNRVMKYVRRDGPLDAPVCFLSIEDGGTFSYASVDDFMAKCFQPVNEAWERTTIRAERFGKPGQFMAKIMLALFAGSTDSWGQYLDRSLHVKNEANVKFYPIPRHGNDDWNPLFSEAIGLSEDDYIARCRAERPVIIFNRWKPLFQPDRLHIILGAKMEWTELFGRYVYMGATPYSVIADGRGRTKYAIHCRPDGTLAFAYFDIFRRGCRNDDVTTFADTLRPFVSDDLRQRVILHPTPEDLGTRP